MKQCITASPRVDNREAVLAIGTDKDPFLEVWFIHQLWCKEATKKNVNQCDIVHKKIKNTDIIWMSREVMGREASAFKVKRWRDSGRMKAQPDQLTGSTHEGCVEWSVPKRCS